ncbi:unnamed protein product [Parnassius apollo]|uniref:(apollo) hypothetical protein n=1 Tax=Parnassius apollo TaxID=110799 RepID=A0A8S3X224_PARAO|nr:unnamed protein product [Parnassius apollo]
MENIISEINNEVFEEDEVFDNTSLLANFEYSAFKDDTFTEGTFNGQNHKSNNRSTLNVSALCCDEEISGYDKLTGRTWIYPTNYPVRDYQFNIIKASLLKNTLVSLPTGLGKTFIAAVIMYNFYRWYPLGKIVFTAPTRPLVAQQIEACYNIIAIPPKDTIEMTGHMQVNTRKTHWKTKRVFFATPQVIYNDIKSGICPGEKIRCLVIDEAHRARGNYAYCQIVSTLTEMGHKTYRLLALSATPGSKVEDVITVVKNLHIAHLELRTENCIDVAPYSHSRKINTVVVQLGPELTQLRQQYVEILDFYARRLKQLNILPQNLGNLSKGRVVMLYKEYQCKERGARHPQHNYIMKDFTLLIALYHGLELLVKHGSRVFLNFFDEHPEKSWIQSDDRLTALLERLRDDLGINPLSLDRSILPDGTIPEIPKNICFGHPKFYKLKEIMLDHFERAKQAGQDTRAIVFCEYRESVNLVHCLLLQCRPLITPQMFVGQGASGKDGKTVVSQKQQLRVMRSFRAGDCNALVATCVAEEGLDVGSVDLILCFDISTRSPIRLVQRCGRTGRERGGQVFILVTEGREHQTLMDCMRQRDGLNKKILQSKEVEANLYKSNPRMVPHDFIPECQKMYITVAQKPDPKEKSKGGAEKVKAQKDLRSMLMGRPSTSSPSTLITEEEFKELFPCGHLSPDSISKPTEYWCLNKDSFHTIVKLSKNDNLKLTSWLEWQRTLQKTVNIDHSRDSEVLTELLQYCDAKRFELPPTTQNPAFPTQDLMPQNVLPSPVKNKLTNKKQKNSIKSPIKKDGDIRALFSASTKSTKNYTKLINDLGVQNEGNLSTRMINLLVDLSLENANINKNCYVCLNVCDCSLIQNVRQIKTKPTSILDLNSTLRLPDISLLDDVKADAILKCAKSINESITNDYDQNIDYKIQEIGSQININDNFIKRVDLQAACDVLVEDNTSAEDGKKILVENFDIGDIEDIFAESSPEMLVEQNQNKDVDKNVSAPKETLEFFGLDSIEDIFADYDEISDDKSQVTSQINKTEKVENINEFSTPLQPVSPSILSGRQKIEVPTSPILCSQARKYQLSTKKIQPQNVSSKSTAKKQLIVDLTNNISVIDESKQKTANGIAAPNNLSNISNKSMLTITQLVEMINKTECEKPIGESTNVLKQVEIPSNVNERSSSPILLTQADRKKIPNASEFSSNISNSSLKHSYKNKLTPFNSATNKSLIILDSDSDFEEDTQIYAAENVYENNNEPHKKEIYPTNCKRKFEMEDIDVLTSSPYFNKKQKLNESTEKPLTLQAKVLAALASNEVNNTRTNNNSNIYCALSFPSPSSVSQKENISPLKLNTENKSDNEEKESKGTLDILQQFRRNVKSSPSRGIKKENCRKLPLSSKRQITFSDSDDDFIGEIKDCQNNKSVLTDSMDSRITNHKVRKKKKRKNQFLDEEAELSDDGAVDSGDELSDESVGSIIDFICDDNVTHTEADMHAHYLRSVRSPVKGVFKIPQLPKIHNIIEVCSQFVEEDDYEMDSFCVDSHIGLTQVNEVSELDIAERLLKEKRKKKKNGVIPERTETKNSDSPVIRRKNKNVKRQIQSDSDDSS